MSDQNLTVEHQIRPSDLMGELGIKKDTYYAYLKHLDLQANKDPKGKAYLDPEQANLVRALRVHVEQTGKMEGFDRAKFEEEAEREAALLVKREAEAGSLVQRDAAELGVVLPESLAELKELIDAAAGDEVDAEDIRRIVYGAGELKAQEMMLHQAIQQELAAQMTYEDLPEELQTRVRVFKESSGPKFDPTQAASAVLGKWREIRARRAETPPEPSEAEAQPVASGQPQAQSESRSQPVVKA